MLILIDLIICKNVGKVLTSFISDPFIHDLVRYHCPVVVVLKQKDIFDKYDRGDYDDFRTIIKSTKWENVINPDDLDSTAKSIPEVITNAAKISIPNELVNIRPNDVPWFKSNIRKLIRQRKRLHKKSQII